MAKKLTPTQAALIIVGAGAVGIFAARSLALALLICAVILLMSVPLRGVDWSGPSKDAARSTRRAAARPTSATRSAATPATAVQRADATLPGGTDATLPGGTRANTIAASRLRAESWSRSADTVTL